MGKARTFVTSALSCAALLLVGCTFAPSFSEDEKAEMRDTISQYQRAVLEDLVVTEAEYRDSVDALRDCIQDAGWIVDEITQDGNHLGFQSSYSGDNPPARERMSACESQFITQIGPIWASQRTTLTS